MESILDQMYQQTDPFIVMLVIKTTFWAELLRSTLPAPTMARTSGTTIHLNVFQVCCLTYLKIENNYILASRKVLVRRIKNKAIKTHSLWCATYYCEWKLHRKSNKNVYKRWCSCLQVRLWSRWLHWINRMWWKRLEWQTLLSWTRNRF